MGQVTEEVSTVELIQEKKKNSVEGEYGTFIGEENIEGGTGKSNSQSGTTEKKDPLGLLMGWGIQVNLGRGGK